MLILQAACAFIVVTWLTISLRREPAALLARRYLLVVLTAWVAEDTCIHLYGFYSYSPSWSIFVDRVPLMVLLIWPVVILSAGRLARAMAAGVAPLLVGALVVADASLMEPVAVQAGLWRWTHPGIFGVPPVGILGWGILAALVAWWFGSPRASPMRDLWVVLVAPLLTHLGLLASWWGLFRWVDVPWPSWPVVGVAWLVGLLLVARALSTGARHGMPLDEMVARMPAATFFMVLLLLHGLHEPALVAWALAFSPPNLALVPWERLGAALGRSPVRSTAPPEAQ